MILGLDVGNSQIYGGVFDENQKIILQFRKNSRLSNSSDEFGLFLVQVLRENKIDPKNIQQIAVCSVVPDVVHSLKGACQKYFKMQPFLLQAGTKTGLKIKYRNPLEVGADRIANSIAGTHLFPGKNLIIVDFGTATTFDVVTSEKEYLGGMILPGLRLSMEALETKTARLPSVEILAPKELVGRSTVESIQSGLYFGNLAVLKELSREIKKKYFENKPTVVIGTGGFSRLFENEKVFDALIPELVLLGLHKALAMNVDKPSSPTTKRKKYETNTAQI
ncbi:MAG: type III pantothenate kinase [Oligoflexia bacterium]|nr:type III pantothenate kinase [Oligoflexia bacterium]